jgi:cytochrome c
MARGSALAGVFVGLLWGGAAAQQPAMEDLRQAPPERQVKAVGYCGGRYTVGFADGSSRKFGERDVRFATDSSPLGPGAGRPVLVPTGRVGDRALVVFVGPGEMTAMIRASC